MIYWVLANAVVIIHLLFVVFVGLGGLLVLRWRWMAWVHLPAAIWGAAIAIVGWTCPLTPLENMLRRRAGGAGYEGGFIEHHLVPLIYLERGTDFLYVALGVGVIIINAPIYAWALRRWRRSANRTCETSGEKMGQK